MEYYDYILIFVLKDMNINIKITDMETTSMTCKVISNVVMVNGMDNVRANVIARRTGSEELGMVKAMMIANLKEKLNNGVAHFIFVRKDGTLAEKWGTCVPSLAAAKTNGRGNSREDYATTAFYSITDNGWRSFRWETLVKVF